MSHPETYRIRLNNNRLMCNSRPQKCIEQTQQKKQYRLGKIISWLGWQAFQQISKSLIGVD
eukprot:8510745-Ditylum_brightwellii.AAC.1